MLLQPNNHRDCFQKLTGLLLSHRSLWSESAFTSNELSWERDYPELCDALLGLKESELQELQNETKLLEFLTPYIDGLGEVNRLCVEEQGENPRRSSTKATFGIPGRKLKQAEGFVSAAVPLLPEDGVIVDWCSGRGYLARQLHYASSSEVVCLEKDPVLCRDGHDSHQKIDKKMSQQVTFQVQDVLQRLDSKHFTSQHLHTALHACGQLHMSMLEQVVCTKIGALACSPCCYQSISDDSYTGLSVAAKTSGFTLDRRELKLATAELWTANSRDRELRNRELLWRVAFDLRSREVRNDDSYQPTPSVKKSLLKKTFRDFTEFTLAALLKMGRPLEGFLPLTQEQEAQLLHRAQKKLSRIQRLEKAQLGFRKALEYWLLLDRVLFLEENGYQVRLLEFCKKSESARNIVILART